MIAVVRYNAGNVRSVCNALVRLGAEPVITDDPDTLRNADHVLFPGVGHAASAMQSLRETGLDRVIPQLTQPFLGICLGMQLLCREIEEGSVHGLEIFPTDIRRFPSGGRVPHMGWNDFSRVQGPLFNGLQSGDDMYFVHSYCADIVEATTAVTEYLVPFSAALHRDNFYGVQFHPEKSGRAGLKLLENFLNIQRGSS